MPERPSGCCAPAASAARRHPPSSFLLGSRHGHEVDFHLVAFDAGCNGVYGPPENGEFDLAHAFEPAGRIPTAADVDVGPAVHRAFLHVQHLP